MRKLISLSVLFGSLVAGSALGGGSTGGGSPPAIQELEMLMMANSEKNAGLFDNGNGEIGLGLNRPLSSEIRVSKVGQDLVLSDIELDLLSKNKTVNVVRVGFPKDGENKLEPQRSYNVEDGEQLGELVLKDRRQTIRASVQ